MRDCHHKMFILLNHINAIIVLFIVRNVKYYSNNFSLFCDIFFNV